MNQKYKNSSLTAEERAKALLSVMTLEEKFAQLSSIFYPKDIAEMIEKGEFPKYGFGGAYMYPSVDTDEINRLQRYQIENTRLGIPFLLSGEAIHGLMYEGATVFPTPLALGASFDRALMSELADVIGAESESVGVHQVYAPNLDISRDPRWGRVEENYGEDPYLTAELGVSYIKAVQKHSVATTVKHYIAHGSPEGGFNCAPSHVGEREIRETMLEPFERAVKEGGCMSVMPAYHEIDGIPMHASKYWLKTVLRDELGFKGTVVADSAGIMLLINDHHIVDDALNAGITAITAGIDFEIPDAFGYGKELLEYASDNDEIREAADSAVLRLLTLKFKLGLFEKPYIDKDNYKKLRSEKAIELSRRAARESIVLLKNNGILPLNNGIKRIALTGPNSDYAQLGGYTSQDSDKYGVSLKEALTKRLGSNRVSFVKGSYIAKEADIEAAVKAASENEVTIVVLGDNSSSFGGINWGNDGDNTVTCGENFDSSSLVLPRAQRKLLKRIKETGTKVVLILVTGRPYCIKEESELSDAVIQAFYPGEQGGNALCDILFGDFNPSGKLPISFPKAVGLLPCYYNYKPSARGYYKSPDELETDNPNKHLKNPAALYPFGYGLSYTEYVYSGISADGRKISVTVENKGEYAGTETVMLFISQKTCPITPLVKKLRGFKRVWLEPKESKTVEFYLTDEDISYIGEDMKRHAGKGIFNVFIGDKMTTTVIKDAD